MKDISSYKKMSPEDVQGLLHLWRRGGKLRAKKGKGSFKRRPKHQNQDFD